MIALLIDGHEFHVPSDPCPAPEPNVLDEVSPWWGLGLYLQNALRWAVVTGGTAYVSNQAALRRLARDGYVTQDEDGLWRATDTGRQLLEEATS